MDWIKGLKSQVGNFAAKKKVSECTKSLPTKPTKRNFPLPFINNGELIIPHNTSEKYRWWAGGQSVYNTLLELGASDEVMVNYIGVITHPDTWEQWLEIKQQRVHPEDCPSLPPF